MDSYRPSRISSSILLSLNPTADSASRSASRRPLPKPPNATSPSSSFIGPLEREPFSYDAWSNMIAPAQAEPDMDQMAQSVLTQVLSHPIRDIPASFCSPIMRIIESHTKFRLKSKRLQASLDDSQQRVRELEKELAALKQNSSSDSSDSPASPKQPSVQTSRDPSHNPRWPWTTTPSSSIDTREMWATMAASKSALGSSLLRDQTSPAFAAMPPSQRGGATLSNADTLTSNLFSAIGIVNEEEADMVRRLAETSATHRGVRLEQALQDVTNAVYGIPSQAHPSSRDSLGVPVPDLDSAKANPGSKASAPINMPRPSAASRPGLMATPAHDRTFSFQRGDDSSFSYRDVAKGAEGMKTNHGRKASRTVTGIPQNVKRDLENVTNVGKMSSSAPKAETDADFPTLAGATPIASPPESPTTVSAGKSRIPSPAYSQLPTRPRRETSSSTHTAILRGTSVENASSELDQPKADATGSEAQ